ncbi:serine/threonine protein kinase [Cylindrospermum sp. NIES-4074]|nr:serine/threonine protein kinase [Cylindrospermum sp. NIES-4074]
MWRLLYIERFIIEGQTLARLSQDPHPHIVGVIEIFQEGNIHCLVMEFVPGENLFQAVKRRGALPEAEIVPCIRQIGEALTVVHQSGLVHRDAHPGNIMLQDNGRAVLIDFGIAKQIIPTTQSSTDKAAHDRFAPYEQRYKGSRDPRVDIYCLAATLYYGVTGQNPTNSLARKLENDPLIPPQQIIPGISDGLNQAILNGMALEPQDRPPSMPAWLALLSYKPEVPSFEAEVPSFEVEVPKVRTAPPIDKYHTKQVVRSISKPHRQATRNKPIRTIPWVWLIISLLANVLMGFFLTVIHAPFLVVVWTLIWGWSMNLTWDLALIWTLTVTLVWASAVTWASALFVTWASVLGVAWAVSVAWAWGWTWASISALAELEKSFSKFNISLILAGTYSLGFGLGWIVHRLLNPAS